MKRTPKLSSSATETRWLMILPVAALAFGCESSKAPEPAEEPARANTDDGNEVAANDTKSEEAEPSAAAEQASGNAQAEQEAEQNELGTLASGTSSVPAASPSSAGKDSVGKDSAAKAGAAEGAEAVGSRRGAAAKGEGFTVWLEGKSSYRLNEASEVQVVLTAEEPFKCNEQYPYRFKPSANAGLSFPSDAVRDMNVDKKRSTMSVPFTPKAKGSQTLSGELSFSVCTDDKCLIEKQPLSIVVDVEGS